MRRQAYQMKAGNLSRLKRIEDVLPDPDPHEVQVAVHAIGLNFADIAVVWGVYKATPEGQFIPGLEYAGIVQQIGSEVAHLKVGDKVMGVTRFGAYATHLNIDARYVMPIPPDWSMAQGAAYLVQVLTAYYGLKELANLQQGQTVLIHSAAGGVGIWANRIAKTYEAYTIGTVGRPEKVSLCQQEGYDQVIVRNKRTFRSDLLSALDGRELEVIMECIGGKFFKVGFELLAPMGRSIVYGSARYISRHDGPNYLRMIPMYLTRPRISPMNLPSLNKSVMAFNLIWLYHKADLMHQLLGELEQMNLGAPIIGHEFTFTELPEAIRYFQTGKTTGKVVIQTTHSHLSH